LTPDLSPQDRLRLERTRFTILSAARAAGAVIMLLGLWIWLGDIVHVGGAPGIGFPIFVVGFAEGLILPQILVRRWRTPPGR
jgi:hypothetical protein